MRGTKRRRGVKAASTPALPEPVLAMLLRMLELPCNEDARATAARVLSVCNCKVALSKAMFSWISSAVDPINALRMTSALGLQTPEVGARAAQLLLGFSRPARVG
jgi:hypothetical protein